MASGVFKLPGVALITGAGGTGIGAAVARGFARSGCTRLAITDLNPHTLRATETALLATHPNLEVLARAGDITSEPFVKSLAAELAARFARLDYSVHCAGVLGAALRTHETPADEWERVAAVNWKGAWLASREALARMLAQDPLPAHPAQRGAVVNIASQLGVVARAAASPYCASKAAVINMTRSDAIDYAQDGIRVNCVCPGVIETPMTTGSPEVKERLRPAIDIAPMRRMGTPDEVADAVLFLCSSQASFIQGHALVVDGGYTIN
ncbi:NAD(P)-binding protein [Annulohypoxylon bovei var. microspora]|nr:NAD(P)-binding protein [Annulohypoxylon bovei var. microspora]